MGIDEVEDMLFGRDVSPDFLADAINDEFEDEILDCADDYEPSWELEDSPMLTPATTDHGVEVESQINLSITGPSSTESPANSGLPPLRDRYSSMPRVCWMLMRSGPGS
jgi:hypothetical protein